MDFSGSSTSFPRKRKSQSTREASNKKRGGRNIPSGVSPSPNRWLNLYNVASVEVEQGDAGESNVDFVDSDMEDY